MGCFRIGDASFLMLRCQFGTFAGITSYAFWFPVPRTVPRKILQYFCRIGKRITLAFSIYTRRVVLSLTDLESRGNRSLLCRYSLFLFIAQGCTCPDEHFSVYFPIGFRYNGAEATRGKSPGPEKLCTCKKQSRRRNIWNSTSITSRKR